MINPFKAYLKGKIYLLFIVICAFVLAYCYYLSGLTFDTNTLLSSEIYFNFSTNVLPILAYKLFRLLANDNADVVVLIVTLLASTMLFKLISLLPQSKLQPGVRLYLSDVTIFFPLYIVYVLLPSKEQVCAVLLSLIYMLVLSSKSYYFSIRRYLLVATFCAVIAFTRPASLLLAPLIILSLFTLRSYLVLQNPGVYRGRFISSKITFTGLTFFVATLVFTVILGLNTAKLSSGVQQIIFQTSYEIGSTSTQLLDSKLLASSSEVSVIDMSSSILQSFLFGAPYFSEAVISTQTIIISAAYIFSNILVVVPNIVLVLKKSYLYKINLSVIFVVLCISILSWLIFSIGLAFNSGTGIRYYLIFFFANWLNFAVARRLFIN